MNKKTLLCLISVALSFFTGLLAHAQQASAPSSSESAAEQPANDADIQLLRQNLRDKRKQVVAANVPLTPEEASKFWPLYDQYIGETIKINDVRFDLIKTYAENYKTLTDDQADDYIKRWLALDGKEADLRLKFIPEFKKVISPKKTAMFFQVDRRVTMMLELKIAGQVPLITP